MWIKGIGAPAILAAVVAGLIGVAGHAGTRVKPFSPNSLALKHSVAVIGPNDRVFEGLLEHDFPFLIDVNYFQQIRPLLAIVHNNTRRVVKAYVVEWVITNSDGSTKTVYLPVVSEPYFDEGVLTGTRTVVGPAGTGLGTQLVSPFFHWSKREFPGLLKINAVMISFQAANMKPLVANILSSSNVRVRLDGAIFGDGVFVGPDTSKLYEKFQAEQQAEVDEGAWVLGQLKNGLTAKQLRDKLDQQIYKGRISTRSDLASLYAAARGEAASNLLSVLNLGGQTAVQLVATRLAWSKRLVLRRGARP